MNQQNEMKINAMARKSFPSLHTFSIARRRKSGASGSDKASCQDDVQKRKVSVDHTVLLGDDSRHTPSQDFSRSFDVDGQLEFLPPHFTHQTDEEYFAGSAASTMMPSHSDPSIFHHNNTDSGLYPCLESSRSIAPRDHELKRSMHSCPAIGVAPLQSPSPHGSPPPSAFNRSSDPTLQARIDAIRIQQKLLGENHPDVIFSLSSLAKLQQKRGNHTEAAAILRESQTRTRLAQSTPQSSFGGYCVQSPPKVEHSDVPTEITVSHQG